MTDQPPGSGSSSRPPEGGDEEGAPNPFSRESSGDVPPHQDPGAVPDTGRAEEVPGFPPYGQRSAGPVGGDQPYAPSPDPAPQPYPDPSHTYGQGPQHPFVPPAADPYAEPAQPPVDAYGQQYGPQYGQPGGSEVYPYQASYGGSSTYGVPPVQHPQAVAALVTGLLGVLTCPFVGIAGIVLGNKARKEIDAEPYRYTGRGMATAGFVLGIVGTVFTVLFVLLVLGLVATGQ